jgi:Ca2+-binding EF-hand superfamily protein
METATAAAIPAADPLAEAKRRFARIDQDGDGRFDRLDFRLKRVSLFGMVDANEDGYLTLDETLLSPEAFQKFDTDGDGKISSREMADRRGFSLMDTNRDDFVSFEEYVNFLRLSPE